MILTYLFFCGIFYGILCIITDPIGYIKWGLQILMLFGLVYITQGILGVDLFLSIITWGMWIFTNTITILPFLFVGYWLFDSIRSKIKSSNVHS